MTKISKERGIVIIIAFLTMGILLFMGTYFLSFTLAESRISKSQEISARTYYLAETGINKAIWKLKNDETTADGDDPWETCFVTTTAACPDCNNWSDSFTFSADPLVPDSSIVVSIKNTSCARGELIATSTIALPAGKTAQRVVKTIVFKSLASPTEGAAVFSGGASEDIEIQNSKMRIFGNLFSNNNLDVKYWSVVEVYDHPTTTEKEGKILVENNFTQLWSTVSSTAICAKNICQTTSTCACIEEAEKFQECKAAPSPGRCPPKELATPMVDFDSDSPNSFKSRAQAAENAGQCLKLCNGTTCLCDGSPCPGNNKCVLDDDEFEELLWAAGQGGTLTLNTITTPGITYVTGFIELRGGRSLVVNGALVADDNIVIGGRWRWIRWGWSQQGLSQLTINRPTATTPSGLLTKRKIDFGQYFPSATTTITGVIYALDEIRLTSISNSVTVIGGIIARKLSFNSVWWWWPWGEWWPWGWGFNFYVDNDVMLYGLGYMIDGTPIIPAYSPIITVEHWEEAY